MAKIVIDAGHGGDDQGSSGNGIIEKDLTLDISNYMYDRFKSLGIPVKMTRTTDETLSPNERVTRVLDAFGNSSDVIVLSNHINAGGGVNPSGKLTFFEKNKTRFISSESSFYHLRNLQSFLNLDFW